MQWSATRCRVRVTRWLAGCWQAFARQHCRSATMEVHREGRMFFFPRMMIGSVRRMLAGRCICWVLEGAGRRLLGEGRARLLSTGGRAWAAEVAGLQCVWCSGWGW